MAVVTQLKAPNDELRSGGPPPRLGILADHPIQYQAPLYRTLAGRGVVDVDVAFLSDAGLRQGRDDGFGVDFAWDIDLLGGYPSRFIAPRGLTPRAIGRLRAWVAGLDALVVYGYRDPRMVAAMALARAAGVGYLIRCDSGPHGAAGGWRRHARRAVVGAAVRGAAAGLAIGRANEAFYADFGARAQVFAPYSVDNERFARGAAAARARRADRLVELGLPADRPVVVFAGKLTPNKRPLDAVAAIRALGGAASLIVVGDGALRDAVEAACAGLPAACVGFVNQSAMASYYALGDVLVLPTAREKWGLVVNEAMACGLVPVVSDGVGCAPDLVEGLGRVHPVGDVEALVRCLRDVLDQVADPAVAAALADRVAGRVGEFSLDRTAEGFEQAALLAAGRRQTH